MKSFPISKMTSSEFDEYVDNTNQLRAAYDELKEPLLCVPNTPFGVLTMRGRVGEISELLAWRHAIQERFLKRIGV